MTSLCRFRHDFPELKSSTPYETRPPRRVFLWAHDCDTCSQGNPNGGAWTPPGEGGAPSEKHRQLAKTFPFWAISGGARGGPGETDAVGCRHRASLWRAGREDGQQDYQGLAVSRGLLRYGHAVRRAGHRRETRHKPPVRPAPIHEPSHCAGLLRLWSSARRTGSEQGRLNHAGRQLYRCGRARMSLTCPMWPRVMPLMCSSRWSRRVASKRFICCSTMMSRTTFCRWAVVRAARDGAAP